MDHLLNAASEPVLYENVPFVLNTSESERELISSPHYSSYQGNQQHRHRRLFEKRGQSVTRSFASPHQFINAHLFGAHHHLVVKTRKRRRNPDSLFMSSLDSTQQQQQQQPQQLPNALVAEWTVNGPAVTHILPNVIGASATSVATSSNHQTSNCSPPPPPPSVTIYHNPKCRLIQHPNTLVVATVPSVSGINKYPNEPRAPVKECCPEGVFLSEEEYNLCSGSPPLMKSFEIHLDPLSDTPTIFTVPNLRSPTWYSELLNACEEKMTEHRGKMQDHNCKEIKIIYLQTYPSHTRLNKLPLKELCSKRHVPMIVFPVFQVKEDVSNDFLEIDSTNDGTSVTQPQFTVESESMEENMTLVKASAKSKSAGKNSSKKKKGAKGSKGSSKKKEKDGKSGSKKKNKKKKSKGDKKVKDTVKKHLKKAEKKRKALKQSRKDKKEQKRHDEYIADVKALKEKYMAKMPPIVPSTTVVKETVNTSTVVQQEDSDQHFTGCKFGSSDSIDEQHYSLKSAFYKTFVHPFCSSSEISATTQYKHKMTLLKPNTSVCLQVTKSHQNKDGCTSTERNTECCGLLESLKSFILQRKKVCSIDCCASPLQLNPHQGDCSSQWELTTGSRCNLTNGTSPLLLTSTASVNQQFGSTDICCGDILGGEPSTKVDMHLLRATPKAPPTYHPMKHTCLKEFYNRFLRVVVAELGYSLVQLTDSNINNEVDAKLCDFMTSKSHGPNTLEHVVYKVLVEDVDYKGIGDSLPNFLAMYLPPTPDGGEPAGEGVMTLTALLGLVVPWLSNNLCALLRTPEVHTCVTRTMEHIKQIQQEGSQLKEVLVVSSEMLTGLCRSVLKKPLAEIPQGQYDLTRLDDILALPEDVVVQFIPKPYQNKFFSARREVMDLKTALQTLQDQIAEIQSSQLAIYRATLRQHITAIYKYEEFKYWILHLRDHPSLQRFYQEVSAPCLTTWCKSEVVHHHDKQVKQQMNSDRSKFAHALGPQLCQTLFCGGKQRRSQLVIGSNMGSGNNKRSENKGDRKWEEGGSLSGSPGFQPLADFVRTRGTGTEVFDISGTIYTKEGTCEDTYMKAQQPLTNEDYPTNQEVAEALNTMREQNEDFDDDEASGRLHEEYKNDYTYLYETRDTPLPETNPWGGPGDLKSSKLIDPDETGYCSADTETTQFLAAANKFATFFRKPKSSTLPEATKKTTTTTTTTTVTMDNTSSS